MMGCKWGIMLLFIKSLYSSNINAFRLFSQYRMSHFFFLPLWDIYQSPIFTQTRFLATFGNIFTGFINAAQPYIRHSPAP